MGAPMTSRAGAAAQRLWTTFRGFTAGQQAVTAVAVAALLIGGYFLLTWTPAPTYAPLYTNLAPADASAIVDKLNSSGVAYQLGDGGTSILVPQDKVAASRLTMSAAGLPGSAQTGYSLLDKEGVTTSQFKQQIDYQRAVEGELDKTIQAINGVNAASVHLAIPQQDVFNDNTVKPSASVLLSTDPAVTLTAAQVQSVVNLVSSSVPGMTAAGITVSDSSGNVLKAPGGAVDTVASADSQAKLTAAHDAQLAAGVQSMIDKAIGPGHAQVTVNSVLNFNRVTATDRSYVYDKKAPPLSQTQTRETYKGAGGTAGTLGSTTDRAGAGGNGSYLKTANTVDNALGTHTLTTQYAPGQVQHLNVAVALDKSVKNLNVAAITALQAADVPAA